MKKLLSISIIYLWASLSYLLSNSVYSFLFVCDLCKTPDWTGPSPEIKAIGPLLFIIVFTIGFWIILFFIKRSLTLGDQIKTIKKTFYITLVILVVISLSVILWGDSVKKSFLKCPEGKKIYTTSDKKMFCYTPSGYDGKLCHTKKDCGIGWCITSKELAGADCFWQGTCEGKCADVIEGNVYNCFHSIDSPEDYLKSDRSSLSFVWICSLIYNP